MNSLKRRLLAAFALVAIPVGVASAAYACQVLATLSATPGSGPNGTQVTATGGNYSGSAAASNVDIHLDGRTGRILASTRANGQGRINTSFTVSNVALGNHVLVATQTVNGAPKAGTPGRAPFNVTLGGASSASHASTLPSDLLSPVGLGLLGATTAAGLLISRRRRSAGAAA